MTFSDSGAHVSQICDASIHTHLLGYWVRDRQEFTLEEAVRMITLAPALAWGFADRGLVREGMRSRPQRVRPRHRRPRGARAGRRPARPAAAAWSSGRSGSSPRSSAARSRSTTASTPAPPPAASSAAASPGLHFRALSSSLSDANPAVAAGSSAHPEVPGDAGADDPAAVVADDVVEVADAQREVGLACVLVAELVDDRVGVEVPRCRRRAR